MAFFQPTGVEPDEVNPLGQIPAPNKPVLPVFSDEWSPDTTTAQSVVMPGYDGQMGHIPQYPAMWTDGQSRELA